MRRRAIVALLLGGVVLLAGCSHRLVASPGEHTVKIYPDEATFEKVKGLKGQGGAMGMLGGLSDNFVAQQLDNDTPVRIISQDSEGAQIEVTDGPKKGLQGFVAKPNLN